MKDRDQIMLARLGCQWIGSDQDPMMDTIKYCGHMVLHKESCYCGEHYHRVYQQGTALSRRPREQRRQQRIKDFANLFNEVVLELESEEA